MDRSGTLRVSLMRVIDHDRRGVSDRGRYGVFRLLDARIHVEHEP
jgi:hypothetical protein